MAENNEQPIGKISHYFGKIGVGVIELTTGDLKVGDRVRIQGHNNDFEQNIDSMQVDHQAVTAAKKGDSIGVELEQPVKENDMVYKIIA